MERATSEYVRVVPSGIDRNASQTRRWNAVATTSVGKSNRGLRRPDAEQSRAPTWNARLIRF